MQLFKGLSSQDLEDYKQLAVTQELFGFFRERLKTILQELETGTMVQGEHYVPLDYPNLLKRQGECVSLRYILNILDNSITIKNETKGKVDA